MNTEFSSTRFIRTGGSVSFEERGATGDDLDFIRAKAAYDKMIEEGTETPGPSGQPNDMLARINQTRAYIINGVLVEIPKAIYTNDILDLYTVRRTVVTITGIQRVETGTLQAVQLEGFAPPGVVTPMHFVLPDGSPSAIPEGNYLLQEFSFSDLQNGYTDVSVSYRMYREWELVKP